MKQQLNILSSKEDRSLRTGPHVHANVQFDPYLSRAADCVHPFMEAIFSDGCGLFQQDATLCQDAKTDQEYCEERINELKVDLASELPQKLNSVERP